MGQNRLLPYRSNIGTRLSNARVPLFTLSSRKGVLYLKGRKWLCEAVHEEEIRSGALNLIQAPVGSGKTTWALEHLSTTVSIPYKMLYLIDTRNGNQQIVTKHDIAAFYSNEWQETVAYGIEWFGEVLFQDQIVVMTYAKFGVLAERYPQFGYDFELILCDEIHSLPKFCNIPAKRGDKNYHILAKRRLEDIVNGSQVTVVGLSATPQKAEEQLCCSIRHITVDDDVRQLEVKTIIPYTNKWALLEQLSPKKKGIVYFERIASMKEF